jgi:hypothetical protein
MSLKRQTKGGQSGEERQAGQNDSKMQQMPNRNLPDGF